MSDKTVYFSLSESMLVNKLPVYIEDIASVYCTDAALKKQIENIEVPIPLSTDKSQMVVTSLKIIELITKARGDVTVSHVGTPETIIYYKPVNKKKPFSDKLKILFLMLVAFFGTGYSIMSYNGDVGTASLLENLYTLFTGNEYTSSNSVMNYGIIGYSLGLCIGMIIFFNHGLSKNSQDDPTPLQVQMRSYEQEVNNCIVKDSNRKKETIDVN